MTAATLLGSRGWLGGLAVLFVTIGEGTLALPILMGASRHFGRGPVVRGIIFYGVMILLLALLRVILVDELVPAAEQVKAGGVILLGVALYLGYRLGVARDSSYRSFVFDKLIPEPRGGFRNDGFGVGAWGIGVEGLKIGAASIGTVFLAGWTVACGALAVAISTVLMLAFPRPSYYWQMRPTLIYMAMLLPCAVAGLTGFANASSLSDWVPFRR